MENNEVKSKYAHLLNKDNVFLINNTNHSFYIKQNGQTIAFRPKQRIHYTDEVANLEIFFDKGIELLEIKPNKETRDFSVGLKDLLEKVEDILEKAKKANKLKKKEEKEKTFSAINEEVEVVINQAQKDIDKFYEVKDIMDGFYTCLKSIGEITCYEGKEREKTEETNNQPDPANENK